LKERLAAGSIRLIRLLIDAMIVIFALFPIVWGLSTSLKSIDKILALPPQLIPESPSYEHYATLLHNKTYLFAFNSAVVALGTLGISLLFGVLAGYAIARYQFRGRTLFLLTTVAVMSVPIASLLVPTYTLMAQLGLLNSRVGLMLLYSAYQMPLVIWILYAYFLTVPVELENAALIDGYSRLQVLARIVVPLSGPGLIAAGLFVLTFAWNDFVVAVVMLASEEVRTLPISIYLYLGFSGRQWGPLLAASMVSILPVVAIFVYFQRYFLSGLTGGGVKG